MNYSRLRERWLAEEQAAKIHGWDFSHIEDRCSEEPLPWDFHQIIKTHLKTHHTLMDMDTGGGEFLLSLKHPNDLTSATEGYEPNITVCRDVLLPLGIDFRPCSTPESLPFDSEYFDVVTNRHGSYCPEEILRVLKPGGLFLTQQVGEENDRDLVQLLLPGTPKPFPGMNVADQMRRFQEVGFEIVQEAEAMGEIRFSDIGALVWFAKILQWEFPAFSVANQWENLLVAEERRRATGVLTGTTHRFLLVARKRS